MKWDRIFKLHWKKYQKLIYWCQILHSIYAKNLAKYKAYQPSSSPSGPEGKAGGLPSGAPIAVVKK